MNKDLNDETWEREFFIIDAERRKNKKRKKESRINVRVSLAIQRYQTLGAVHSWGEYAIHTSAPGNASGQGWHNSRKNHQYVCIIWDMLM